MDWREGDWTELVKRTRQKFGVGLDEAHDIILADDEMRRVLATRINHGRCRTLALRDIRLKGERSFFVRDGDRIRFRGR